MTPSLLRSGLLAGAALAFLATATSAQQYSQEEAQACTPDAVKFCSDTIPDVGRTAACIRANFAALTPACQVAFTAATGPAATPAVVPGPAAAPEPAAAPVLAAPTPAARPPAPVTRTAAAPPPPAAPAGLDLFGTNLFAARAMAEPLATPRPRYASRRHHHVIRESRETRQARASLARACATGYVSADVCQFTARLITLAQ